MINVLSDVNLVHPPGDRVRSSRRMGLSSMAQQEGMRGCNRALNITKIPATSASSSASDSLRRVVIRSRQWMKYSHESSPELKRKRRRWASIVSCTIHVLLQ